MKRLAFLVTISLTILGLVGCGIVNQDVSKEQSDFKQNYSIGSIVEAHQELLLEGPRTLSGSEAGPPEPFIQSQEIMILQVDSANASELLAAIQSDLEENLRSNGAEIVGNSGRDIEPDPIAHFSYDYGEGSFYGIVNVWGLRGEGTTLIIISEVTEGKTQK
jgi:hypothetical protein